MDYNPIRDIGGILVPPPFTVNFTISDVSAPNAGRTESAYMNKNRIGQALALDLQWEKMEAETLSRLLILFDEEYFDVTYLDPKYNTYKTREFYAGDRKCGLYSAALGLYQNVSVSLITRDGGSIL